MEHRQYNIFKKINDEKGACKTWKNKMYLILQFIYYIYFFDFFWIDQPNFNFSIFICKLQTSDECIPKYNITLSRIGKTKKCSLSDFSFLFHPSLITMFFLHIDRRKTYEKISEGYKNELGKKLTRLKTKWLINSYILHIWNSENHVFYSETINFKSNSNFTLLLK